MSIFKKIIISFICFVATTSAFSQPNMSELKKSVLLIVNIIDPDKEIVATGTGFLINEDGYMVTNHHVVDKNKALVVLDGETANESTVKKAKLIWSSSKKDLAIIKVEGLSTRPTVTLAKTIPIEGDPVTAIGFGNVGGLDTSDQRKIPSITRGNLSKIFQGPPTDWDVQVLAHTAPLNGGNSGGPLFDGCGRVIAVNTAKPNNIRSVLQRQEIVQGVNFSSHIEETISELSKRNIAFTLVSDTCISDLSNIADEASKRSLYGIIASVIGVLVALIAIIFSLKKPRQQIINTIETYTQHIKRGGKRHPSDKASTSHTSDKTWKLSGTIKDTGERINIEITENELKNGKDITIGRNRKLCDYTIPDVKRLSRRHARFICKNGELMVEDLNSSNKTYIDNNELTPGKASPLSSGSVLSLGKSVYLTLS